MNYKFNIKYTKTYALILYFIISSAYAFAQFPPQPEPEITAAASYESREAVIRVLYKFPENFHQTLNKDFYKAEILSPENISYSLEYSEGISEKGEINFYGTAEIIITADISDSDINQLKNENHNLEVKASYQLCDENGICYFPGSKDISVKLDIPENQTLSADSQASTGGNSGILRFLFLAFIGGLLLNIMPCVFPLLSIKALSLIKQSENDKKEILFSSIFYSAGIILSLIILAVFLIIIKNAGQFAGWGFQMQNKWFVLFLITMIYLFALSMFDVFTITLPGVNTAGRISDRKGYTGHFLTGIFAVLVAAPCTAPFLGSAIAFALSGNSLIIVLSFFFIGAGFAFPFLVLGLNPSLIKLLPKPGRWSVYFKEILGFILAGTSFYLLISFGDGKPSSVISSIIIFLFIITMLAWIYGKTVLSGIKRFYSVIILIVLLVLSVYAALTIPDLNHDEKYINSSQNTGYEIFSEEKLNSILNEGKSVFVDIYADWCTTCKLNEKLVLNKKDIKEFLKENNTILLKGNFTDGNTEIGRWMDKNNKAGVPVYAFYKDKDSPPVFLPELLTKTMIFKLADSNI